MDTQESPDSSEIVGDGTKWKSKMKDACLGVLKFFLSTSGLLVLNAIILVAGGLMFNHLEVNNEIQQCKNSRENYLRAENKTVHYLKALTDRLKHEGKPDKDKLIEEINTYVFSFALSVLEANYNTSTECEMLGKPGGPPQKWSFVGALIFSLTVVSTIGYGDRAPSTMWGRIVCIVYALVGIPIYMLALANIGQVLANLFKTTYTNICCCGCCYSDTDELEQIGVCNPQMDLYDSVSAITYAQTAQSGHMYADSTPDQGGEGYDSEESATPLTIAIFVYFGFIILGASAFSNFESWTFLDSFYYSAITATTIGFGDLVPDISLDKEKGLFKCVFLILYITFSMAAISMCLHLIANVIKSKVIWISYKLGLKKQDISAANEE